MRSIWFGLVFVLTASGASGQAGAPSRAPSGAAEAERQMTLSAAVALKAAAAWLLILFCAVLNGGLRAAVLVPRLGSVAAFVASGLLLCIVILAVSVVLVPWFGALRAGQ